MSARIRFRLCITKKTCVFFLPSARIRLLWITKKTVNFEKDKKNISKKNKLISRDKELVFYDALVTFSNWPKVFFYFVALTNLSRNLSNVSFISSHSLTFPKIGLMFFFLMFFYRPPSLDFGFLIQNREIKHKAYAVIQCLIDVGPAVQTVSKHLSMIFVDPLFQSSIVAKMVMPPSHQATFPPRPQKSDRTQ